MQQFVYWCHVNSSERFWFNKGSAKVLSWPLQAHNQIDQQTYVKWHAALKAYISNGMLLKEHLVMASERLMFKTGAHLMNRRSSTSTFRSGDCVRATLYATSIERIENEKLLWTVWSKGISLRPEICWLELLNTLASIYFSVPVITWLQRPWNQPISKSIAGIALLLTATQLYSSVCEPANMFQAKSWMAL
jgi:hypothetical protein